MVPPSCPNDGWSDRDKVLGRMSLKVQHGRYIHNRGTYIAEKWSLVPAAARQFTLSTTRTPSLLNIDSVNLYRLTEAFEREYLGGPYPHTEEELEAIQRKQLAERDAKKAAKKRTAPDTGKKAKIGFGTTMREASLIRAEQRRERRLQRVSPPRIETSSDCLKAGPQQQGSS